MKLLELSYKNILSYGNRLQSFQFGDSPHLVLVEGENGAGKSSIKEALTVSIYGRSAIRKMKDIPNWINKNAFTCIKFITNTGDEVEITRGIEPNFSDLKINGAAFNLPDKRKVDELIENEIAKIPFSVFCNTISLSFDDFKSFVNLSTADKRKIVDRIFGIDILTDMRNLLKEELKQTRRDLDMLSSQIEKRNSTLASSELQLEALKERLSKKKESTVDDLQTQISEQSSQLDLTKAQYSKFKNDADLIKKKLDETRENIQSINHRVSDFAEKLSLYQRNRCPHCLNDLTTESSAKTKELIESKKQELEATLPALRELFSTTKADLEKMEFQQNESKSEYYRIVAQVDQLRQQLSKTIAVLESDETSSIQGIIDSIKQEILDDRSKIATRDQELLLLDTLDGLLSDTGIKKSLIDKIIPALNSRLQEISERLEFKFSFLFDSDFNPIITYLGMEVSPESLSSGQRKKMNLIVLLAFIEIIKMKHSQMNVMFLDEIFSSLDKNNVYKAIEILREYADRYCMTIFVVSHESLPEEFFDSKIIVESKNHFSEMKVNSVQKKVQSTSTQ